MTRALAVSSARNTGLSVKSNGARGRLWRLYRKGDFAGGTEGLASCTLRRRLSGIGLECAFPFEVEPLRRNLLDAFHADQAGLFLTGSRNQGQSLIVT